MESGDPKRFRLSPESRVPRDVPGSSDLGSPFRSPRYFESPRLNPTDLGRPYRTSRIWVIGTEPRETSLVTIEFYESRGHRYRISLTRYLRYRSLEIRNHYRYLVVRNRSIDRRGISFRRETNFFSLGISGNNLLRSIR